MSFVSSHEIKTNSLPLPFKSLSMRQTWGMVKLSKAVHLYVALFSTVKKQLWLVNFPRKFHTQSEPHYDYYFYFSIRKVPPSLEELSEMSLTKELMNALHWCDATFIHRVEQLAILYVHTSEQQRSSVTSSISIKIFTIHSKLGVMW